MTEARRKRRFTTIGSAFLLAAFWMVFVGASAFHTDDGCVVEIHCLACRLALSGRAAFKPPPEVSPSLEPVGPVPVREVPGTLDGPAPQPATRGPPLP